MSSSRQNSQKNQNKWSISWERLIPERLADHELNASIRQATVAACTLLRLAHVQTITAPANRNLTPPGRYLLFLINSRGVPSIARIVQII